MSLHVNARVDEIGKQNTKLDFIQWAPAVQSSLQNLTSRGRHLDTVPFMKHTCHYPGCETEVPPKLWGCLKHWKLLPRKLQRKLWTVYRPGQEIDKRPSEEYIKVAKEIQEYIARSSNSKTNGC